MAISPQEFLQTTSVAESYDRIAEAWHRSRCDWEQHPFRERGFLDRLVQPLAPGAAILDVGCGCGVPSARYLAELGFRVTGLDASPRLLEIARRAVPGARFLQGDMRTEKVPGVFDAVVAWDSVFHLPCADHAGVFERFRGWLRPRGRLLLSLGGSAGEFTSQMQGSTFYYCGHAPEVTVQLLTGVGFEIEQVENDDSTSRGHVVVLACRSGE